MCGICGVITKKKIKNVHERTLKALLVANGERGTDSTGIACLNGQIDIYKKAMSVYEFVQDELPKAKAYHSMVGHTRMATHGAVLDKNAHPFREGNIVGIHNGIIQNHKELYASGIVDSQSIFYTLSKYEPMKALPKIQGSLAIAWAKNSNPDTIYLFRHDNPLFIAVSNSCITFSSQYDHLYSIMTALYDSFSIFEAEEDTIYTVDRKSLTYTETHVPNMKKYSYASAYTAKSGWAEAYNKSYGYDMDKEEQEFFNGNDEERQVLFEYLMSSQGCAECGIQSNAGYLLESSYGTKTHEILCIDCIDDSERVDASFHSIDTLDEQLTEADYPLLME